MTHTLPVSRAVPNADPALEPITLAQAKKQLEILETDTDHDEHLATILIPLAREAVEHDTGMVGYQRTYVEKYDSFPDRFELKRRPLISVTSITYIDSNGTSQTLAGSQYEADTRRVRPQIWPAYLVTWPTPREIQNAVTVTYLAGHATAAAIPRLYVQACLLALAREYDDRTGNATRYQGVSPSVFSDAYESLVARLSGGQYQ